MNYLNSIPADAKCNSCGVHAEISRPRTDADPPFFRGDVITEMIQLAYCHHCGGAFCGKCKNGMDCPRCGKTMETYPAHDYCPGRRHRSFWTWLRQFFSR